MALQAYRSLLRSARIAFEGDTRTLSAALFETRRSFENNRSAQPDAAREMIKHAREVAQTLRENIVQGKRQEDGTYRLRIHDDIERGDNESIKKAKAAMPSGKGCCST